MLVMTAPIKPIAAVDVPLPELLGRTARMAAVYTLATARLTKPKGSHDLVAYALDIRLIEADATVAVDADYPAWAAALAAQSTYHHAKGAL